MLVSPDTRVNIAGAPDSGILAENAAYTEQIFNLKSTSSVNCSGRV